MLRSLSTHCWPPINGVPSEHICNKAKQIGGVCVEVDRVWDTASPEDPAFVAAVRELIQSLKACSTAELLRKLVGNTGHKPWITLSERLMSDLPRALENPESILCSSVLSKRQLSRLATTLEILRRFDDRNHEARLLSPRDVFLVAQDLRRKRREFFVVLLVDSKKELIDKQTISIGTLNASLVHPRELFLPAILNAASEIILVHNHPSGDLTPSEEDLALTRRVAEAGRLLGIELLDHVIVSRTGYRSLREEGII